MFRYQTAYNLVLIVEDLDQRLDIDALNRIYNRYLFNKGEISLKEAKKLRRVGRFQDVVVSNCLGSLMMPELLKIFAEHVGGVKNLELVDDLVQKYPYIKLPKKNEVTGEYHAGAFRHTYDIDEGVKPLVQALNKIPFVKTFASCDGHSEHSMYVSFRISAHSQEGMIIKLLDDAFNEVYPKYQFPTGPFRVHYRCGYTDFVLDKYNIYFAVYVTYNKQFIDTQQLFNYIKEVSVAIEQRASTYKPRGLLRRLLRR